MVRGGPGPDRPINIFQGWESRLHPGSSGVESRTVSRRPIRPTAYRPADRNPFRIRLVAVCRRDPTRPIESSSSIFPSTPSGVVLTPFFHPRILGDRMAEW